MRDLVIAGGFALILAGLVEIMLSLFVEDPTLRLIILIAILVVGIAMVIGGIIWKTRKSISDEVIGIIDGGKEEGYKSLEPSIFKRIIEWLRNN